MYKNQFIISQKNTEISPCNLNSVSFSEFIIYHHSSLNISIEQNETCQIALIGFIIDPFNPELNNNDILKKLSTTVSSKEDLQHQISYMSGRFLLLYIDKNSSIIIGDAFGLRRLFYGRIQERLVLTSSPKLFLDAFNLDLKISDEKKYFINSCLYKNPNGESAWFGDSSIDDRLSKLIPNHFLNLKTLKSSRIAIPKETFKNNADLIKYASEILKGTYSSIVKHFNPIQPLTAGWDSRVLLAASKHVKENIKYYVFKRRNDNEYEMDVNIPTDLSKTLNINFNVFKPEALNNNFLNEYKKEHIIPRILPKTSDIQYHYSKNYNSKVINVTGIGAETARSFYGYTKCKISLNMLQIFSGYYKKIPFIDNQIKRWYQNAKDFAKSNNIDLLDLFYWEQRVGNWGSQFPAEQDIAVEEIAPFNNRILILSLLQAESSTRRSPDYKLFKDLIEYMWKESMSQPINPNTNKLKQFIKSNTMLRYNTLRFKSIFQKVN